MAIPLILGAAALLAGGYGVKKGIDAKEDLDDAERYARWAKEEAEEANEKLENQKSNTSNALDQYGKTKKEGIDKINLFDSLICYPDGKRRSRNQLSVNFNPKKRIVITYEEEVKILKDLGIIDQNMNLNSATQQVRAKNVEMEKMGNALKSVSSGTLAGLAAGGASYLGVGALASASTGTAISTLSGAAATNATLAWLGGGSLASGGLGIAGGTAVLGGLVAGPLLAIGGAVMASKAAEKKDEAYEALSRVRGEVKKLEVVISKLKAISTYTNECNSVFKALLKLWANELYNRFEKLAERNVRYAELSQSEKEVVKSNYKVAFLLGDFIREPVMTDDSVIPESAQKALQKARKEYTWK